ncbi:putative non-ribosomal peptide synthetase [Nocardia brasiliensis NBRC 14402]|uniref:Putative non-ribosomal peptide synthetase n=1 Tax=Nocardia brasiliensis TaxID=37326 RepID=A0A060Q386_NOCBR|nr:non-ribosomal peptide synthetase [Nocardia brasiliensis]ASF07150.2 non-ribosomal peptide synthetase [Nocardia brasiliensis]BAO99224.1 putative non-ribosomal peptide synthetase [Nocardia brasiliensis]GAJ79109.1 putative non-ribosomal peptide synthetase [Nocardia brasiliensis NBRC 14402]SUB47581.1 Dimodular nonribosomal peptide synthase [Nocardia brasiliensis]
MTARLPLTRAQQHVWVAQRLDESGLRFVVGGYVRLRGTLDETVFERALRLVVAGAESTRVYFDEQPGGAVTQVLAELEDWPLHRSSFRDAPDPHAAAREYMEAALERPFDLSRAPLFDHHLIDLGAEGTVWFLRGHHLVIDGAAAVAMIRRVADVYTALIDGKPVAETVFDRVAELVEADERYRGSPRFAADRQFWAGRLAQAGPDDAPLFAGAPSSTASVRYIRQSGVLGAAAWQALRARADASGIAWPAWVLAAIAILLHADSGARTVTLRLAVPAKRSRTALGVTSNLLPLRVPVDPSATVGELIRALRAEMLIVLRHQHFQYADMRADLAAAGADPGVLGPAVNVLPFQKDIRFGAETATLHHISGGGSEELVIGIHDNGGPEPGLALESSTSRYTEADLAAHHRRLAVAIEALTAASDELPLGRLRFAPDPVGAAVAGAVPETLLDRFERAVAAHPGTPAVVHGDESLSYAELDARARRLARVLAGYGSGPGEFVALALPRSVDFVVAVVAVLYSGAAYVPLDPGYPRQRLREIVDDVAPAVVVTGDGVVLPESRTTVPVLRLADAAEAPVATAIRPTARQPAYVIYTSGTTGPPKGVVVTHENVVALLAATESWFEFDPDDVWTLFHATVFDFSVWEMWGALCHGGTLVVVDADVARDPDAFLELLVAQRVTVLNQTPTAFGTLVDATAARPALGERLALRYVIFGGEPVEPWRVTDWWSRPAVRQPRLVNMYGITETTVFSTGAPLTEPVSARDIGTPLPGTAAYVLDAALRPCAPGVPGELYVAGAGVAAGYLRSPGRTATRYVADPFGDSGGLMYRSGDVVRWNATGTLDYLGRADRQLKVRGFRLEPGEIEAALCAQPGVRAAAVPAMPDRRLVAFVAGAHLDAAALRDGIAKQLPAHAVPSAIVIVDAIPTTVNGKVDEPRLRALSARGNGAGTPPRTDVEVQLHALFVAVLGHEDIGVDDGFFASGGDSILAIRLADRARAAGLSVSSRDVFEHQTIRALAEVIEANGPVVPAATSPAVGGRLPVTPLQSGMLFHSLYEGGDGDDPYLVQVELSLRGTLDAERLYASVRQLCVRHPHLLGHFVLDESTRPRYEIRDDLEPRWRVVDLLDAVHVAQDLAEVRAEDARIDPLAAPLFAVSLVRIAPNRSILLVTHHHALLDGWSLGILLRELLSGYDGVELPPAVSFRRFLDWSAAQDQDSARRAWAVALDGVEPSKVARPGRERWHRPVERSFEMSATMVAALRARAAEYGLTLNSLTQTLWALTLATLTGSDDIVFGITVSGRDGGDLGQAIGLLMNTVPLRARVKPGETPLDLAVRMHRERVALLAHDHLGLPEVLAAAGATDLFDSSLVFENFPLDTALFDQPDADFAVDDVEVRGGTHFPLTVVVVPGAEQLTFRIAAQPERIDGLTDLDELWSWILAAARALTAVPQSPWGRVGVLPPARQAELLAAGRGRATALVDAGIAACFESHVRATPQAVAVWWDGHEFSYTQMNARANQVARSLRERGVGPGVPVGIALPRSIDLVVAFLALAKLGAVCVPLSERYPPDHVARLLRFTGTELVLRELDDGYSGDDSDLDIAVAPDAIASLMFTSGSTGASKGVEVTHRNIVTRARDRVGDDAGQARVLLHLPYTWDMVVYELWLPLLTGRTVVIAKPGMLDVHDYGEVLRAGRVTSMLLSTGLFHLLAERIPAELARLPQLAVAGDVLSPQAVAAVRRGARPPVVTNLYGPVEATCFALRYPIAADASPQRPVPIGRPADNTRVALLDSALRPVPTGVTGEIYLSGAGLANGYHRAPAQTAARFVADPYGRPGERMYRTGDLGRWGADGLLHFLGRADRQVKVNGFRVEPGEVEAVLRREPGVTAAVVTARRAGLGQSLIAHVVAPDVVDIAGLRTRLGATLPSYLVPSAIVPMRALPLTPTGKVDVGALPLPRAADPLPASTPRQQVIAASFAEALGVAEVGVTDDFFTLGGNSLSALRVVAVLRSALGVAVSLRDLFEAPTVAALERALASRGPGDLGPAIASVPRPERIPLSPAQQRLWTVDYLSGHRPDYLIATGLELLGPVNETALEAAVTDVVVRHEILRTVLPYTADGPVQRILPIESMPPDFRRVALDDGESLEQAMDSELSQGFDPTVRSPLRIRLYRLNPRHHLLLGVLHHIAGDGESLGILQHDLLLAYRARTAGLEPRWPSAATQFADYAVWRRLLPDSVLERQARYWRAALVGLPEQPVLPADRPRAARRENIAGTVPVVLDAATHRALARTARDHGASSYMLVHTALALALYRHGAGVDLPIGVALSGRDAQELRDVVGCVIDTAVVRVDLSDEPGHRDLIAQVRERVLGAYEHKEFPFDRLVELLNPPRSRTHHPLFQVMVTYLRGVDSDGEQDGLVVRHRPVAPRRTVFDLLLNLREEYGPNREAAGIRGEMIYAAELFDHATIESLVATMTTVLAELSATAKPVVAEAGS